MIAPDEALVTAQHLDDQSETFFLALKRGSGPAGLSAMPEQMAFGANPLIRPLLSFSRAQLEQYAQYHQLSGSRMTVIRITVMTAIFCAMRYYRN